MSAASGSAGPRNAQDRLRRLLVMLPWLMESGEVPLAEVAERFGMTPAQVTKDLELVAMCGLPPYVDEMIDVFVDDGMVFVGVPRLFTRPLALSAPEGFALLAAARLAMELPGADPTGPLARGLDKLTEALGQAGVATGGDETSGVAVDLERPDLADVLVEAVASGAGLVIDYYSPSRGEITQRAVVPRHVFAEVGNWYVIADDDRSGERRTFRIDRIERVEPTGHLHDVDPDVSAPEAFFSDSDIPRVRLRLLPRAQWVIDRYPTDAVEPVLVRKKPAASGAVDVTLAVASDRWLERLLVRLGPDASVVGAPEVERNAAELARRILVNYL